MTGALNIKPASGEGGQLQLCASTANTTQAGIVLDQLNSQLRIFGIASADGTTKTGTGTPLVIDPYAKTITGDYTITGDAVGKNEGWIAYPGGNTYHTTTASVTGALKITLPTVSKNTMMSFDVNIYTYDGDNATSTVYHISGYEYNTTGWHNPSCRVYSEGTGNYTNLTVRFGAADNKAYVTIGETNTVWSYPQVAISNILLGYQHYNFATWGSGWSITFVTTLPTASTGSRTNVNTQSINISGTATNVTGTVAVANGGTGVATTTKNYVFAGPTSANGAPAFRALVAADLPAATTSAKGAIIVGSGLAVSSGTVSISGINTSSGSTTKCLTEKGTWVSFGTSNLALGSTAGAALAASGSAGSATTAAKSDHVHPFPTAANVGAATDDHVHGNITNGGCITTAITAANGDYLIIGDSSASGKLGKGPTFVSTTANKFLKDTGAFTAIAAADLPAATTSAKGAVIIGSGLAVSSGTISISGINTSSGSTAKCLTEKGTWASFTNNAGTVTSVIIKGGTNIDVDSESAITGSGTRTISLSSVQNPLIAASSTAAVTSSPYKSSRWAFNLGVAASDLTTGMMITVKIPQPTNTYGSYVSIDNGTTYKPIAVGTGKGRMTTHYAQNNIITLFYDSAGTVTTYAFNGAASTSDVTGGCWRVLNYYDSGNTTTTVRQSLDTTNKNRPLILAYDDNTVTTVNRDYQTYRCNAIYANPSTGHLYATAVHNAVWNDYAEYRKAANNPEPGRVVIDNDNGTMTLATQRLMPGAQVVSDTWGHVMGETEDAKTPIAVAGRVLVYTFQSRENYHAGMAVCSAPNGTVDIMTREEIRDYPDCIVGIVSEIPDYEEWGSGNVKVNGRIWIRVK